MTGLSILEQAYQLLEAPEKAANAEGDETGLLAVNQIYGELWPREHKERFQALTGLRQKVDMSWRFLPAMTYGTAMLLCLNDEEGGCYTRLQKLYERAACHAGGPCRPRMQTAFPKEEGV
ncbi:MAG: hypothetical protein IIW40_00695 [Clostridia bacterium]|nr:hypothetical protein [Clostridia bacterium]